MKTCFILSQMCFTVLAFIICLYISHQLWVPAGVIVVNKYINKELYLLTTTLHYMVSSVWTALVVKNYMSFYRGVEGHELV